MKHLKNTKLHNNDDNDPRVGDYVICECKIDDSCNTKDFIKDKIGKIIRYYEGGNYPYNVTYDDIPDNMWNNKFGEQKVIVFKKFEVVNWSNNKEDLELIINTKKFNL